MPVILWTDEYEVGVESLDADHIMIFSLINHIDEAIRSEAGDRTVRRMLRLLLTLAIDHFQHEENLMKKNNYPDIEAHTAEHHQIATKLQSLIGAYEQDPSAKVSGKIIKTLATWVNVHIPGTDMRYRPYISNKKAQAQPDAEHRLQAEAG
ncbi:MAG: hemerythrin family protein [Rhodospirillales bacterium]|nr:hemerythrin family protein [Alphaproteobacteria bacterium]MBL6947680.1 hemerythrin family protein [Rhodospirillales bacterium]